MKINLPKELRYRSRWFCYLDLLGFARQVETKSINQILPLYEKALDSIDISRNDKGKHGISFSWFSDTFIIFSQSNSAQEFALVEQAGRLFFQKLIMNQIPVRGAISCGDLYTQLERNVFIGPALIEAYRYGEGQNWLGFVLTPSAIKQLDRIGLPAHERLVYRMIPGDGIINSELSGPVYAFAFNNGQINGQSVFIRPLEAMKRKADEKNRTKYNNTLEFLHANQLNWIPKNA
ncbi:hypothetical protein [Desulfatitalea tepidiphila]|uniref:hypothetical protein n=1 Tax=Desulfatitalea tepidiphila TaxID=1185843 RepID=UPI0006B474C4|nr:hypothetical protein [Desulfatitalea tepidiphila]